MEKKVIDVACGSRMFYFDKNSPFTLYCDNREFVATLCDGRTIEVKPDRICDFTSLPFENESFYLVVFDPPHLIRCGDNSWLEKKYGRLPRDWRSELSKGFMESYRILKENGTLVFKWNEDQIALTEILTVLKETSLPPPLLGHKYKGAKTHWLVFFKNESI